MRKFPVTPPPADESADSISYTVDADLSHYTGATLVVGDTVFLSPEGVEILASTDGNYYVVSAYSFKDADGEEIGGIYGRDDTGQNVIGLRAVDEAGNDDDTVIEIVSESTTDAAAEIVIQASRDGEGTDTYISLERSADSEIDITTALASGRVRIAPKINLLGASVEMCDIYIKDTYLIIKYVDGATTRYKYLDLSGTGSTWTHATSEP